MQGRLKQTIFQQDSGSDGVVSIEVENNNANVPQGGFSWESRLDANASGGESLQAVPGIDTPSEIIDQNFDENYQTYDPTVDSPKLDFRVNFDQAGSYYVWVRGREGFDGGDTVHVGLNGQEVDTAESIDLDDADDWVWTNNTREDTLATLNISSPGEHTINLWMREAGVSVDKIVLTSSASYDPSQFNDGLGPDESLVLEPMPPEAESGFV